MAQISIEGVCKNFGDGTPVVRDVSIDVADGEFVVLVGPSGCGKSTLLRMISGLESISAGVVRVDGRIVNALPPKDRNIAMVFQTYALFPHMSVERNLAFGLKLRGTPAAEADRRIQAAAKTLGLLPLMHRKPAQLSGGQRQRVAIGRALVREPAAFLMDEPLSNLDTKLRVHMRTEFARLRDHLRTTTVYVTHDQVEALTLGHRVCVLRDGLVQQIDSPERLFSDPANAFVAGFIGSPEMNFARASVKGRNVRIGSHMVAVEHGPNLSAYDGREIIVGLRPSDLREASPALGGVQLAVEVELVERLGSEIVVVFPIDAPGVRPDELGVSKIASDVDLLPTSGETTFSARLDGSSSLRAGQRAVLSFPVAALHFFDPATGRALPRTRPS